MLNEEIQSTVISMSVKTIDTTLDLIKAVLKMLANKKSNSRENLKHGEQSIKDLNKKDVALDSIPAVGEDLKGLKKELKKQGVDFAVTKGIDGNYIVNFKGRDVEQIKNCLETYALKKEQEPKIPLAEQLKKAMEKAKEHNQKQTKTKTKTKAQER